MITKLEKEFLKESNALERVYDQDSLDRAIAGWKRLKSIKGDLVVADVLEAHQTLMKNLNPQIAGKFRDVAVRVGWRTKSNEGPITLAKKTTDILAIINSAEKPKTKKEAATTKSKQVRIGQAKRVHILFEDLHPFEDGNGRIGRLLWQLHRQRLGLPIQVIHEGKEQVEYYKWFD